MSYGLPRGASVNYGANGFPDWVYQLAQVFGLRASTYPGHQESNRNEAGFAPNPQQLNRGIDWAGPVENMQRFADYLMTVRGSLEQIIWQNPNTGQRAGVAGGRDVTDTGYYASDYGGHRDHVHTRQSAPIPMPGDIAPGPPPADAVTYGIDISNHQGVMDLDQVKAEGFDFVFAKVSEGATYRDPFWPRTRDDAQRLGLILAGYHYVRTGDPAAQARLFVDQLGDKSIPAMLDVEAGSGDMAQFWAVKAEIEKLGVRVALSYIPDWYWEQIGKPDLSQVPGLIRSEYVSGSGYASVLYPGNTWAMWGAYGGRTPDILQFTDRALVAGKSVDANAFRGTPAQLRALLNLETPTQSGEITMSAAEELEAQSRGVFPPSDQAKRSGWPQPWRFVYSRFARPFNAIVKDPARGPWGRVQPDGSWQNGHTDSDEQTVTIGEQIAWRNEFSDGIVRDHGDVMIELMEDLIARRKAAGQSTSPASDVLKADS
ncbi:glycoside hydrolase family 25 protein [Mycobacterium sp. 852013-50091_SCH5140682]|uniref:glycoside hydrolase family 25 protein n=1 Tax=Mycobacterium sp. 852013-50091_SCH5140682 TaxID=1834109 RepID=UPI0009EF53D4|nr:glycoside hydrolase family 25 protein [Mycobacterium sp. 852013-50091_SCH5140682]